jgi:xylulokinase
VSGRGPLLVGVDSGTQSTTACVFDVSGKRLARASVPIPVNTPRPGWAEQDPALWWRSTLGALKKALKGVDAKRVAALGVSYQRETFTLVDSKGRFVRDAILWLDARAEEEVRLVDRDIGPEAYHRTTGKPLDTTSAVARLLWLRKHERGAIKRAARWVDVGAALVHSLTGEYRTCAAGTDTCGLVDITRRCWATGHVFFSGLRPAQMPLLVGPAEVAGHATRNAARATGLLEGTPVVLAGGDGNVFAVGVGAGSERDLGLTLGTSIVLGMPSREALVSPRFRTLIGAGGGYLLECVLQSGTYLLRWFVERFTGRRGARAREAYWDRLARDIPPGAEGLVTLPNWWGVRFPEYVPEARGVTLGWSNTQTEAHYYRSLLEGLSFELGRMASCLQEVSGRPKGRVVRAGGGGASSDLWLGIIADVLGLKVTTASENEAVALGAAILAGVGVGVFGDAAEGAGKMVGRKDEFLPGRAEARAYSDLYEKVYVPLFEATLPALKELHRLTDGD